MINQILAAFFAKFKTKNPTVYGVITMILIGIYASLSSGAFAETFGTPDWLNKSLEYLTFAIAALTGTHTSAILEDKD